MNKIFRVVWNQATQSWVAVSELTKAHKKQSSSNSLKAVVGTAAVLLSINTAQAAVAIGETTANNTFTQSSAQATGNNAVAIGQNSKATKDDTIALGTNSKSTNTYTVALGRNTDAAGQRSMAFGNEAKATANDTIAFGSSSEAKKNNDIIIGKEAKSRDEGGGHSVAVGYNATAGSTKTGAATDVTSTGKNTAAGGVAIGVSSYTGLNRNNAAINSSVAIGAGAGAGFRAINADGIPTGNGTDPDDNATVLAKAFGNTSTEAGNKDAANRFDYKGVDINEGTAVGRNTRAIGDQAVALGAQSIAGQGAIAIGGNDITQFANARYFMSNKDNFGVAEVSDHDQSGTLASKTISQKYQELVGAALNTAYQATYAQNGSTVIGMQAHSTTPLGVAIGTNALVRKGAYGATTIGSGSAIQANAEAAVAIGMGSWVNGKFGVAAGTASRAEQSAVAAGYKANADKSAVAVGDSSKATNSSVAVGQLAQATKEADIAVGQGAKASGNQGAIAMGLGTNAQGDSSIMIGGSDISSAANQRTEFEKATGGITAKSVTEKINGKDVTRNYTFAETTTTPGTIAEAYKELTGLDMDVSTLDFADAKNKNGHASTSLGVHALSKGNLATAIGAGARADAIGSLALGTGAHATKQNAVAIGTGSTTALVGTRQLSVNYDSDGNIVSDNDKDKIAYTFKWAGGTNTSEGDVVSFGSSGAERQLKNVAAGRVAEDSTDAINGSQLNSITKKIAAGFNTSGNEVAGSSGVFTSKKANADSAKKDYETAIRSDDKVQLQVGNNLKLDRDETVSEVDVPDDFDKTKTVKKKIRKADFAYSLNPVLTNLTSAEFIGTGTDAPTTKLTNDGVTITPKTAGKKPVSLTQNGLDNGGNPITDVAGNLDGAKTGTTAPTNEAAKPDNADTIKNNAATVGDVLNAGWNLQEKGTAKDFVTAYDTVNFVDGNGTTVSVENTDNKISTIKYSVNTGNGLQKDTTGNTISVKPADKSLEVTNEGVKVKAADNTLTTDANGLKVNTGTINPVDSGDKAGTVVVNPNDTGKIATVDTVVNAVNNAAWNAIASKTNDGENGGIVKKQAVKAGDTVTFEADKNIKIAQTDGKFTFSTKDNVEFTTVKVGNTANGKKPVELKSGDVITANNNPTQPTTALNVSSDGKPTQITGVGSVLNTEAVPTIPAGTATDAAQQPKLVNLGTAHGQPALGDNVLNAAATVRDLASMGWVVSSDKTTDATTGEYKDVVKNANEVKFVGKNAAKVSGKTDPTTGIRTITVDVEVPSVETAKITQNTDGSVTGPAGETLTKALKDAKDELAKLPKDADAATVKAAQDKVDAAQKAIDNSPNSNKVATAQNVADMINNSGFTLKTSKVEGGEKDATSTGDEVINPGKAVEMVAGKNLTVKQEANGKVTYSTKDNVEFTSVKVGDTQNGKAPVNFTTEAAKPANNNGTDKTPTTALNVSSSDGKPTQLKGVGSVLNTKAQPTSTGKQGDTPATAGNQNLVNLTTNEDGSPLANEILNSAATVGDLANMGWVVSTKDGNDYKDVVKNANQVDFVGKNGITVTGKTGTDGVRTITVEAAQTPVVYTNKAGDKLVKVGDKFYKADEVENGKPKENAQVVPNGDVIASMNNGGNNAANNPMHLSNIGSNLPTVNDTNKQAFDPNSTAPKADKTNKSAPMTAAEAADLLDPNSNKFAGNNAATVSDVLNAGWNLQGNGQAVDFVKPFDTVNFVNGKGTKAVVETADNLTSTVKFDVDAGEITAETKDGKATGKVVGPTTQELKDALEAAKKEAEANPDDEAKQKALKDAQSKVDAANNQVATAQNVADMINASGFTLKADKTDGDNLTAADLANGETINPGDTITMKAGKNMSVKHEKDGSITYATKDEVEFNTVKVGGDANTYVDDKGNPVTKKEDGSFEDAKGNKVAKDKVSPVAPVTLKTEKASPANNNAEGNHPTTALNVSSDGKPTQITGVGSTLNVKPVDTNPNGTPTAEAKRPNLVDLVGTDEAPVNKNAAATVGDLQNMGWVVSTKDSNGYTDVVKNANQVDFVGKNGVTVTGKTGTDGVRTITVEAAQSPMVYTDAAGNKLVKVGDKFYPEDSVVVDGKAYPAGTTADQIANGAAPIADEDAIDPSDVIASMNDGNSDTATPMTLANVKSNLPHINDKDKTVTLPDGSVEEAHPDYPKAGYIDAQTAADMLNPNSEYFAGNNAATVSDVLNAGWNLQGNGSAVDFVKPFDTVNFVNGKGTKAVVETADNLTSTVKFDVDAGEITSNTNGSVNGPTTAENAKKLAEDLAAAQKALNDLPANADDAAKKKAQDALKAAQDAAAPLNKVATAQNVADMINASGFTLKTSNVEGGQKDATSTGDEVINPGKAVEMIAGKNLTVKQEANGKVTYATKDDVSFNTVNVGGDANTYVDDKGNPVTKKEDGSFEDAKGNKVDAAKVSPVAPVTLKTEKASPANNNAEGNHPTTALNIAAGDKPTQLKGVGSVLNTKEQPTSTGKQGDTPATAGNQNLVNLGNDPITGKSNLGSDILNSAATVGDLANMGWVVSTKDGNGYTDVVKNANQVDFKGDGLATVTGETDKESGIRTITVNVDAQKTVEAAQTPVVYTNKDGDKLVKVGDKFYKAGDVVNGKPKDGAPEVAKGDVIASMNNGDNKTNKPMQLANIGSNLPTVNDTTKQAFDPNSTTPKAGKDNKSAPITADEAAAIANKAGNNAATVSDVLNAGWNLQNNGEARDFVKPYDTVNFINGKGTVAVVETADDAASSTVKFDVDAGEITSNTNGSVNGPTTAENAKKLADDLKKAEQAVKDLPADATPEAKKAAQDALKAAQDAAAPLNKVATAQNVADMINASGFTLKTSNVDGGEKVSGDDEVINPGKAVEMIAGKNLTVKQEANGKVTYATKDDVEFNTVKVGGDANTYVDDKGNPVTKQGDSFVDAEGNKVDAAKVSPVAPVTLKTEKASPANNNAEGNHPTTALNIAAGDKPTQLKGVGSVLNTKEQPTSTGKQGDIPATAGNQNLVNLGNDPKAGNKSSLAPEILNSAATVGDLANMGWVVSTKDGNGYTDVVKNANQVDFKGTGLATVTGETDKESGIRTITVNVDAQKTVEAAQTPVVYTNKDGNKLVKVGDKFYKADDVVNGKPKENAQEVPKGDVIASMNNGDNKTNKPMQLANIGSNLPTVNDTNKQAFDPNSTEPKAGKDNKSAPITAKEAADIVNKAGNNAATVSDVLNAGWNLQGNGSAVDFVKPFDTVNFVNGKGTKAVVETADNLTSTVKFDVDAGEITSNTNGSVSGPTTAENAKKLAEDLAAAQKALNDLPANADDAAKKKAQDALKAAQDAAAPLNKVATAQNVADMINASGFTLKTSKVEGGEKDTASTGDEVINPGKVVEMVAGKNLTVKQEANGKVTYSTKDDVEFNTVKVGGDANTYVDDKGNPVTKQGDSFVDAEGNKVDAAKVSPVAPVTLKTEKASPANNNAEGNHPTTALNIAAGNKPTQLKGVGSVLNTADVKTSTGDQPDANGNVTTPAKEAKDKLVNLGTNPKEGDKPLSEETLNSAATVRDLANMGWVVSAKDNNYTNTVKNANKVEFKGKNGISVTGKDVTQQDGTVTREITVAIAEGSVTDKVTITTKDGKEIPAIKIGDNYYSVDKDGKPVGYEVDANGKPTANNRPLDVTGAEIKNNGAGFVTGNTVATAIQESGWNVGLANTADADKAFNDADKALSATKLEKVNPNDNVRFADGKGTKAAVATVERVDEFGKKVTDTYVKFDVDAGKVEAAKDAAGNNTGAVTGPVTTALNDALTKAQEAQKALKPDATKAEKDAAQAAVDAAQAAVNNAGNQVATAQNVAEAINNSGWRTNSTTATGGAKDTLINPGKAVNFESGKNMEVAQTVDKDGNVAYTYKTKDDVQFNSVQFGGDTGPKITSNGGNINVSGPDGKAPTKITGVAAGDISPESSDAVNGAQIYALSRGNVPNVKNITVDGKEYKNVIVDENGTPILKTYNVKGQKEIITNSVVEAIYNMNEQGIKFFHSNDGVERLKVEDKNSFDSSASGKFATAIGSKSSAEGTNAVAIGFNSVVTGNDSISIGTGNRVTGNNSGAFGDPSTVSGQRSYSVGNNNTVATNDTFVLGNEVTQTVENSVILGKKSTATAGDGSATGTLNNIKQDGTKGTSTTAGSKGTVKQAIVGNMVYGGFEGATADGVVSVGAAGNERRIQNVAAGEISATSTDAINGSQLYSVAQGVGNRLGDLNNKINRNNKNLRAGIAGANAAAGLPQVYIPGKSMVAASAGTYKGQSALAVGYSRASDNGKLILKLQGNANTRGDVGGSVGVGYQW